MANRHFGEIGDVWKHLPLSEMLVIEKPGRYWESHAGAARYALKHSRERNYGVFYFLENAGESEGLSTATYRKLLNSLEENSKLKTYPGSPYIAMSLLGEVNASFLFCDVDESSLSNVAVAARKLRIPPSNLKTVLGDGVPILADVASNVSLSDSSGAFAFIDPYRLFVKSDSGMNSLELFAHLAGRGIKTVLWYGYDSYECREMILSGIRLPFIQREGEMLAIPSMWCGDISLVAIEDPTFNDAPGVFGCGIATANLSNLATTVCDRYGRELAKVYESARFPDGKSGALNYQSIPLL